MPLTPRRPRQRPGARPADRRRAPEDPLPLLGPKGAPARVGPPSMDTRIVEALAWTEHLPEVQDARPEVIVAVRERIDEGLYTHPEVTEQVALVLGSILRG